MKYPLVVAFLLAISAFASANELEQRENIQLESRDYFLAGDFQSLESIAKQYRATEERTESGLLKLPLFYDGIARSAPIEATDAEAWRTALDQADRWIATMPKSPTPYIAKSHLLLKRAWAYRGTSYANDVAMWNMLRFKQEAKKARDLLIENKSIADSDPEFYGSMLSSLLATGDKEEDYEDYLDEALTKFPNFDALYFSAATFYDPRWCGSESELSHLALQAVGRTSESRGLEMYARIYWAAGQRKSGGYYFMEQPADWQKMRAGIQEIVSRYPDQWNINRLAFFACLKEDYELARELMDDIVEPIIDSAWYQDKNYLICKSRVAKGSQ